MEHCLIWEKLNRGSGVKIRSPNAALRLALGDILVGTKQHPRGLASQTPPRASTQPSSTTALDTMSALGAFAPAPTATLGARSRVSRRGALGTNNAKTIGIRPSTTVRIRGPRAQAVSTAVELLPPAIANPDSCSRANELITTCRIDGRSGGNDDRR